MLGNLLTDADGPLVDRCLGTTFGLRGRNNTRVDLFEDARSTTHEVGLDLREVVDNLVNASVNCGGESELKLCGDKDLAEGVRQRQPEEVSFAQGICDHSHRVDGSTLVRPVAVCELNSLGFARGARGVDESGQIVRANRCVRPRYRIRV